MTFEETIEASVENSLSKLADQYFRPIIHELQSLRKIVNTPYGAKKRFSITEISEITGRSRSTVHKDIKNEKLSAYSPDNCNNIYVATEEAVRYFGLYQLKNG